MPINEASSVCGRREPHRHKYKFNGVHVDHVQDSGLVNGTTHNHKWTAPACRDSSSRNAGINRDTNLKPWNAENGYVDYGFRSRRTECVLKKESKRSSTSDNSTAKLSESDAVLGSILVNGAKSPERAPLCTTVGDQGALEHDQSATTKSQRKKKKPWYKKRNNKVACPEKNAPPLPQQEREDWESEIQEVKVPNWKEMTFGTQPYGPEDVVNFAFRDLTLEKAKIPWWQVSAKYVPATHHQRPIEWSRYKLPTEPGQFSDVEE